MKYTPRSICSQQNKGRKIIKSFNIKASEFILTHRFKAHSHQANAKAKKIKEQSEEIKEKNSNIKENFRFRFHFRSVWIGP